MGYDYMTQMRYRGLNNLYEI